jgi:cysteine desulfurase
MQPVSEIAEIARRYGVAFHTDAIQAVASIRWDMENAPIDLLSMSPHKFYGPKGVGILYVRRGVTLEPGLTGGGQEGGLRAGTVNVPFAVGAATALRLAVEEMEANSAHYQALRDQLIGGLTEEMGIDCILTGHPELRLPNNASFAFRGISGNDLLMHLDMIGVAASSGSACKSGDPMPAATLQALGLSPEWTSGGLRLTVGRQNTSAEISFVVDRIPEIVSRLRRLQPATI